MSTISESKTNNLEFSDDEIATTYAKGGVGFFNTDPVENPPDLIMAILGVLHDPPFARAVSTLPALLLKNKIDYEALIKKAKEYNLLPQLGFILDVTRHCALKLKLKEPRSIPLVRPENTILLIDRVARPFYSHYGINFLNDFENKWNVGARFQLEGYERQCKDYIL